MIGCLIPEAADKFRTPDGKGLRVIDTLAQPGKWHAAHSISVTQKQRLSVCQHLVKVAAALERQRLVYSDWNYANALWSSHDYSAFVIDIDGCRHETNANIVQSGWEDPFTPGGSPAMRRPTAIGSPCSSRAASPVSEIWRACCTRSTTRGTVRSRGARSCWT